MHRHPPHECCGNRGASIADNLVREAQNQGINISIDRASCLNMCRYGPCVRLYPAGKDWLRVGQKDIPQILDYISSQIAK